MNKKAQGLPITTIIIAILALLVLVVIILIFTGKVRVFGGELVSCTGKGGFCTKESCYFGYQTELQETDCKEPNKNCCLPVLPAPAGAPCGRDEHCTNKCGSDNKCT
ncbi:hypothetical protein KY338_01005 [Candidatus Woesearchaeota archaeon]|nr:hypothetical protein [Candidatus Woesearchaeota archaeon]MBW3006176.1 hypothetical protein [Candidatus Woesearchaeota archaeon]